MDSLKDALAIAEVMNFPEKFEELESKARCLWLVVEIE